MNKILMTVGILAMTTGVGLADVTTTTATTTTTAAVVPAVMPEQTFDGTVKSITAVDPANGINQVTVLNPDGTTSVFLVKTTTTLHDPDSRTVVLNKINPDTKVTVTYVTTPENAHEAKTIRIVR